MPDTVMDPLAGPDGMFDPDKKPSRGQWQTLAVLACRVLRLKVPTSRYEATLAIVRLRHELDRQNTQGGGAFGEA